MSRSLREEAEAALGRASAATHRQRPGGLVVMIGRGELPLSAVFRESFLRRCAPHGGELREFGELLARLAGPPCTYTFEAAREQYRAAVREYRQAEEALRAVRTTAGVENRTFHLATIPVLRTMDIDGRELEMVLWKTEPSE